jgi:flagellar export protein FliJ
MAIVQQMALVQKKVEEARLLLAEAAKGRKAIETLREKRFDEWRRAEAKKESDILDEVGMQLSYFHGSNDSNDDEYQVRP